MEVVPWNCTQLVPQPIAFLNSVPENLERFRVSHSTIQLECEDDAIVKAYTSEDEWDFTLLTPVPTLHGCEFEIDRDYDVITWETNTADGFVLEFQYEASYRPDTHTFEFEERPWCPYDTPRDGACAYTQCSMPAGAIDAHWSIYNSSHYVKYISGPYCVSHSAKRILTPSTQHPSRAPTFRPTHAPSAAPVTAPPINVLVSNSTETSPPKSDSGLSTEAIVGIVMGTITGVIIGFIYCYICCTITSSSKKSFRGGFART